MALLQALVFGWFIGSKRFKEIQDDMNRRSEIQAGFFWVLAIKLITPLALLWILVLGVPGPAAGRLRGLRDGADPVRRRRSRPGSCIVVAIVLSSLNGKGDADVQD